MSLWEFLELRAQCLGPHPLAALWLRLPGRSARGRVVGCGFGPCLDIDTLHVFKVTIVIFSRSSSLWPGVHGVAGHGTLS